MCLRSTPHSTTLLSPTELKSTLKSKQFSTIRSIVVWLFADCSSQSAAADRYLLLIIFNWKKSIEIKKGISICLAATLKLNKKSFRLFTSLLVPRCLATVPPLCSAAVQWPPGYAFPVSTSFVSAVVRRYSQPSKPTQLLYSLKALSLLNTSNGIYQ